jgi:hypothetical protein
MPGSGSLDLHHAGHHPKMNGGVYRQIKRVRLILGWGHDRAAA